MATKQTSIRMSTATRAKADELARRYSTITEVVAVAIERLWLREQERDQKESE